MAKMSDTQLAALIKIRVGDALGAPGDQISAERQKAERYYRGDKLGNEEEGRSQIVSRDVAEAVDSLMPALMRVFYAGDTPGRFDPRGPEDEKAAKQATDYVNWIVMEQNPGFDIGNSWIWDALVKKVGTVKVWWDDTEEITKQAYHGLTPIEYEMLKAEEDVEITEEEVIQPDAALPMQPGMPPPEPSYNVTVTRTNKEGRVRYANVPPEEFLIERGTTGLDDSLFCAHRYRDTVSNLVAQGYDKKDIIAAGYGDEDLTGERAERFRNENNDGVTETANDETVRRVWVTEAYLRCDYDGDGRAELRKVTTVGDDVYILLDNEEIDDYPFACITPIRMPHKFYGRSIADQTIDLQLWKTAIIRQFNDNLYLSNSPRPFVKGRVDLDSLLSARLGQPIYGDMNSAIEWQVPPFFADKALAAIQHIDHIRGQRTGVTEYSQGLDADSLNKTATGISLIQTAAQERQELIARTIAEGYKRLYRLVLKLVTMHQSKPKMIRMNGDWVPMDPRGWKNNYDVSVSVGLGTGNKDMQLQRVMMALQMDEKLIQAQAAGAIPADIVTPANVYAKLTKFVEALGWKSPEPYYTDPANQPPKPPPENPDVAKAKMQIQADGQKAQADHQLAVAKAQADHGLARDKAVWDFQLKAMETEANMGMKQGEMSAKIQMQREGQAFDMQSKTQDGEFNRDMKKKEMSGTPEGAHMDAMGAMKEALQSGMEQVATLTQGLTMAMQKLAEIEARQSAPKTISVVRDKGKIVGGMVEQAGVTTPITLQ